MAINLLSVKKLPAGWTQGKWKNLRGKAIKDVIISDDINRIEILLEDGSCFGVAGMDYEKGETGTAGVVGFFLENVDVDTPASAGCVPRLVRLFGFLFGACCWIGFPLMLLGLPTVYLFGMSGGNWFTWSFYALSWVVALVWWFLCFRWGPTREFIETYADRPNNGKPRNY